jgi:hypothetical protein
MVIDGSQQVVDVVDVVDVDVADGCRWVLMSKGVVVLATKP